MISNWETSTLGQILTLQRGLDLPVQDRRGGAVPVVASTGIVGYHNVAPVGGPGVVIGRSGSIGGGQYIKGDFWPLNTTLWVKDFKSNDPRYCYYLLRSIDFSGMNAGSGVPTLNRNHLHPMPTVKPPLAEQKKIATLLGMLDDRVNLLRESNRSLESIAQALFKSWFVDFDPVRAKMEKQIPECMDEATVALFPDVLEELELGMVPRGWRVMTLSDAFEINPRRFLKKGQIAPYLDMASLATSGHCVEPPVPREMGSGAKFCNGDTLLARITPCLENGKSAFVDFLEETEIGWGSTEFVVLRPKEPLPEYFGYLLCRHQSFRDYAINSMSGTSGRQRIQNDVLERYLLAIPDEAVASAFKEIIEPIRCSIRANHRMAQTLVSLRDTLLPRLISGQLRLPDVENQLESATA